MDKYEYKVRSDEIKSLIEQGDYAQAVEIADTIDWRRVKSVMMLCTVSDLYKINRRYEDAKNMLLLAYERRPGGRTICYSLCELCIKTEEFVQALQYYKEFVQAAPKDSGRYILQYKLYEAQEVSLEERIGVLEEMKKRDYREKWAYELAYLYHRVGLATRCVEECDELILWFGEGKYVVKAMELKMLHQPLTPAQQEIYDSRFEEKRPEEEPVQMYGEQGGYEDTAEYGQLADSGQEGSGWPSDAGGQDLAGMGSAEAPGQADELDIHVKTMDVGKYNTINLQEELAAGLQEVLGADGGGFSAEAFEGQPGTAESREQEMYVGSAEEMEESEVFFGATGELEDMPQGAVAYGIGEESAEQEEWEEASAAGPGMEPEGAEDFVAEDGVTQTEPERFAEQPDAEPSPQGERVAGARLTPAEPGEFAEQPDAEPSPQGERVAGARLTPAEPKELAEQSGVETAWLQGSVDRTEPMGPGGPGTDSAEQGTAAPVGQMAGQEAQGAAPADETARRVMEQMRSESEGDDSVQISAVQPPKELAGVLQQEANGQISMVLPESVAIEKQITGQMKIEDILVEWERMKKENQEKCEEEVRMRVLRQTGPMFTEFEAAVRDGLLEKLEKGAVEGTADEGAAAAGESAGAVQAGTERTERQKHQEKADADKRGDDGGMPGGEDPDDLEYIDEESAADNLVSMDRYAKAKGLGGPDRHAVADVLDYDWETAQTDAPDDVADDSAENHDGDTGRNGPEENPGTISPSADNSEYAEPHGHGGGPKRWGEPGSAEDSAEGHEADWDDMREAESGSPWDEEENGGPTEQWDEADSDEPTEQWDEEKDDESLGQWDEEDSDEPTEQWDEEKDGESLGSWDEEDSGGSTEQWDEEKDGEPLGQWDEEDSGGSTEQWDEGKDGEPLGQWDEEDIESVDEDSGAAPEEDTEPIEEDDIQESDIIEEIEDQMQEQSKRPGKSPKAAKPKGQKAENSADVSKEPPVEREQAKVRSLSREEKELFAPFIQSRRSREQLVKAIDSLSMAAYTGNLVVTGEEGMDMLTLAKNIIRDVRVTDSNFSGKVARITGQGLNERKIGETLERLGNGALIVEKASGMSAKTAAVLHKSLQQERLGIIVILEDTKKAMKKLFLGTPELYSDFPARVDLEALSNDTLVSYGRQYAREKEYSIDDLGVLALHTRIEELQTIDHVVTVTEVKEIVDEAIRRASRKTLGHFFDVLLARRYDDEDMIVLTEKDFVA